MGMGFGMIFDLFPVMFAIVFVLVTGMFIFTAVKGIGTWNKNNNSPRLTVSAVVVAKRTDVSHHHHTNAGTQGHHTSTSTWYYATFQVDSGDRMEFSVSGAEYGLLAEGIRAGFLFREPGIYLLKENKELSGKS